jgi:hypothetical protein
MRRGTSWWSSRCVRYGPLTMSCMFCTHDFQACKCFCSSICQYTHIYVCVSSNLITLFFVQFHKILSVCRIHFYPMKYKLWFKQYEQASSFYYQKSQVSRELRICSWIYHALNHIYFELLYPSMLISRFVFLDSHKYVSLNKLACLV